MIAAGMVVLWLLVLLAIVGGVAWRTRDQVSRDSELPTTDPADPDHPPDTVPGSVVWLRPQWVNTVPTGPVPLDESPVPQPPQGG